MTSLTKTVLVVLFLHPFAHATPPDPNYCNSQGHCSKYKVAYSFARTAQLTPQQALLLEQYGISEHTFTRDGITTYDKWTADHDDWAAAYLSVTRALSLLEIDLGSGQKIYAIDLVIKLKRFEGDRIFVELNQEGLDRWQKAGGKFKFYRADGRHETGNFKLGGGNLGGSIHSGYDVQGYTSKSSVPRLQINYRKSDSEGDVDIDGFAPLKGGVIPNPHHLSYENSDARQWYSNFVKKMGLPGYSVREHGAANNL